MTAIALTTTTAVIRDRRIEPLAEARVVSRARSRSAMPSRAPSRSLDDAVRAYFVTKLGMLGLIASVAVAAGAVIGGM